MSVASPRIQSVFGPDSLHVGQPAHFSARWTFWFSDNGVRFVKKPTVMMPANDVGEPCEVFADGLYEHLTACFDQNSRPVVAVQRNDGTVELRRLQGGTETRFVWTGRQPQLFFNWEVLYYSGESDVVCFYLKEGDRTIYARMQRDNFAVEYEMNVAHCNLATLEEVVTVVDRVKMYARSDAGRAVTLLSRRYPPFPALAADRSFAVLSFVSGSYAVTIVTTTAPADAGAVAVALLDGSYVLRVKQASEADAAAEAVALLDGEYALAVLTAQGDDAGAVDSLMVGGVYSNRVKNASGADACSAATALAGGDYFVAVIDGGTRQDAGQQSTSLLEGSYYVP